MPKLTTFPTLDELDEMNMKTPEYMCPNSLPYAAIGDGWLSDAECDAILEKYKDVKPYEFPHCNAITRECGRPLDQVLDPMQNFARKMNDRLWKYDLRSSGAWLQTYKNGNSYQRHTDTVPGQNRKLTAVLMLTNQNSFDGGALQLWSWPDYYTPTMSRGTIIVFQPWVVHAVAEVYRGTRQTINMGFWGPNFR